MKLDVSPVASLSKRERVELLLEHWQDFHETLHAVDHDHAGGGDDSAVTGMPRMYHHPSVVELRRCLNLYRTVAPRRYWHLMAFYEAEWRTTTVSAKRRTKKGKLETVQRRQRQRIVPKEVRLKKVSDGVTFVAGAFKGAVHIPSELLEVPPSYGQAA